MDQVLREIYEILVDPSTPDAEKCAKSRLLILRQFGNDD